MRIPRLSKRVILFFAALTAGIIVSAFIFEMMFYTAPIEEAVATFENFLKAFNEGDVKRMWDLLSADQHEHMSFENFLKVVRRPGEDVMGQKIGTLELKEVIKKSIRGREATLVARVIERRSVLRVLEDPREFRWENRDLEGTGEVKLVFEGGGWRMDMPVIVDPDPNKPIHALRLEVEAESTQIEAGDGITLKFTIRNKSFLPITVYHAHTPARVILRREGKEITRFPQVILDILIAETLGPFGSKDYEETIPSIYDRELPTFGELGAYELVPFAEFGVWWESSMGYVEPHRLYAATIEIKVTGPSLIFLSTFNMRFLDFFGKVMGDLDGSFKMMESNRNVRVKLELGYSSPPKEVLHAYIKNLTLHMDLAFHGFFEREITPPALPIPSKSVSIRDGEWIIVHEQTYDVSRFEHPVFDISFRINSVQATLSDGQTRNFSCGIHPLWHDEYEFPPRVLAIELKRGIEQHSHEVGADLALELDNEIYSEDSELQVKITNLTNETLTFLGDRYDIYFVKWLEEEERWSGRAFVETEPISLPPGKSHTFTYPLKEVLHQFEELETSLEKLGVPRPSPPGRYQRCRVICHNAFAEFWIQFY